MPPEADDLAAVLVELLQGALKPLVARLEAIEARPQVPGRDGRDGVPGANGMAGLDGKDGRDGLGWTDLTLEHDGERTVTLKALRGEQMRVVGTVVFPVQIYRGVWTEGKTYEAHDSVTWAGSEWHCATTTTAKPGDGATAWTLKVKRGRDGRDGGSR
jgi:hypothetical protein